MKAKFVSVFILLALTSVWAQDDFWEDDSVLEKARGKHANSANSNDNVFYDDFYDSYFDDFYDDFNDDFYNDFFIVKPERAYYPLVISFVPGLAWPFGAYDTSMALGLIGSAAGNINGLQASGIFSLSFGNIYGAQLAGIFNLAGGQTSTIQAAGIFNIANEIRSAQLAGIFNIADESSGLQAAGIFNIARHSRGLMIAPINIAESSDGVAIGIINIIGNGIQQLSFDYIPVNGQSYLSYQTGTRKFFTHLYAGMDLKAAMQSEIVNPSFGFAFGRRSSFGFGSLDTEIFFETMASQDNLNTIHQILSGERPLEDYPYLDSFTGFKVNLELFRFWGLIPVVGIKTDVSIGDTLNVPAAFKNGISGETGLLLNLFDTDIRLYPKWVFALRLIL